MSDTLDTKEDIIKAKAQGFTIIHSSPRLILLDLDSHAAIDHYDNFLPFIQTFMQLTEEGHWPSKTRDGSHFHIILESKNSLTEVERLLIQALLGSDPRKEFLSLMRIWQHHDHVSLLFKPPLKNKE